MLYKRKRLVMAIARAARVLVLVKSMEMRCVLQLFLMG